MRIRLLAAILLEACSMRLTGEVHNYVGLYRNLAIQTPATVAFRSLRSLRVCHILLFSLDGHSHTQIRAEGDEHREGALSPIRPEPTNGRERCGCGLV